MTRTLYFHIKFAKCYAEILRIWKPQYICHDNFKIMLGDEKIFVANEIKTKQQNIISAWPCNIWDGGVFDKIIAVCYFVRFSLDLWFLIELYSDVECKKVFCLNEY